MQLLRKITEKLVVPTYKAKISQCLRGVIVFTMVCLVAFLQKDYSKKVFEITQDFGHLSTVEREVLLYTELGFYYSYFKTVVEEPQYLHAISKIMYDRIVEYPNEVNAFNRFNIYPEVILGSLYRQLVPYLNRSCDITVIDRGPNLSLVFSPELAYNQPIVFYLEAVWWLAGLTAAGIFVSGCLLSNTVLGGLFAFAQYLAIGHRATRVNYAPNERENFAQPFLILQIMLLVIQLRQPPEKRASLSLLVPIFLLNCCCLLFWQFSQFIFLTQVAIFFMMEQLKIIDLKTFCIFLHAHFCGLHTSLLLLQGNDMLKTSFYTCFLVVVSIYAFFFSSFRIKVESRTDLLVESWLVLLRVGIVICTSVWLKKVLSEVMEIEDDNHVWDMLMSKFTEYKTFHTLLYMCNGGFNIATIRFWLDLTVTLLLPLTVFGVYNVVKHWYIKTKRNEPTENLDKSDNYLVHNLNKHESDDDSGIENNLSEIKDLDGEKKLNVNNDLNGLEAKLKARLKEINDSDKKEFKIEEEVEKDSVMEFLQKIKVDAGAFYNISQMVVFGVLTQLVERLCILLVPQMCIVSSLALNLKMHRINATFRRFLKYIVLPLIILWSVLYFFSTLILYSYSGADQKHMNHLHELVMWVDRSTDEKAVFAGPLSIMATIMLITRRPIVVHPHYESKEIRDRSYKIFKVFGKFTPMELYHDLTQMQVTHLVLEKKLCVPKSIPRDHPKLFCTRQWMWDTLFPELQHGQSICQRLLNEEVDHFYKLYDDDWYVVFKIHDYSVRYMPRNFNI